MAINRIEINRALNSLRHVIFILRDRVILWASEGVSETFGYTVEELRGKSTRLFYRDDESFGKVAKEFYTTIHHFGTHTGVLRLIKKDGTPFDCLAKGSLVNPSDPSAGHIFVFIEITEWIKTETALKEQEKLAAIGQVAADMAHDLKTPLTTAKWFAQMALNHMQSEKEKDYLHKAISEIDRTNQIIQDFLADAKHNLPRIQFTDMNALLDEVMDKILRFTSNHNIQVIKEYDCSLPLAPLDPDQIRQSISNIIQNAVDAVSMKEKGVLSIKTMYLSKNKEIQLSIKDNGEGIEESNLHILGKPFFTTKEKGTGLGLNITYRIIDSHGGRVKVCSKVGEWTEFTIYLPVLVGNDSSL